MEDVAARCELLLVLAGAQTRTGATEAARERFTEAAAIARRTQAAEALARAALGFAATSATGFGDVDADCVGLLEDALQALADSDGALRIRVMARLADQGGTTFSGTPADFGRLIAEETEKWGKVVKFAGIKPG